MRVRYHELVGMKVIDGDGASLGHVVDLAATACGEHLVVRALLIGPDGFLTRIGLRRIAAIHVKPREAPWSAVSRIGDSVELRSGWDRTRSLVDDKPVRDERAGEGS